MNWTTFLFSMNGTGIMNIQSLPRFLYTVGRQCPRNRWRKRYFGTYGMRPCTELAGHLREKNGYYHMVLNYVDEYGKRHTPSKSTGLTVKGNKKRAEKMLSEARAAKEAELEARAIERSTGKAPVGTILFTAFLLDWLEMTKKNVEETTYGAYAMGIKNKIIPYFEEHHPGLALCEVTPKHIQDYYTYELTVRGVSANTVIHRHANIRKALQHAFKLGLIDSNPADRIE